MKDLLIARMNETVEEANLCPRHESGLHVIDLSTITRDHSAPAGVVDVSCVNCGRSGAVHIDDIDVDW
jgi:hypothetical protein